MGNITLLELHVPDGNIQLGPKSLRGSESEPETTAESEPVETTEDDSGLPIGGLLLVVGIIAVLAIVATKLLGEDADDEIAGFDESN